MIVVNTPNGNIGRVLTQELLDRGESVRIISRNPGKVTDLVERGAQLVEGSIEDQAVLDQALEGAEALFWLSPPAFRPNFKEWSRANAERAAQAAARHGVERVAVLSSVGAQNGPGSGPISMLLEVERAFISAKLDVGVLRPGFFMENFFGNLATIASDGVFYGAIPADAPVPMVATRDIGVAAADLLTDHDWGGVVYRGVHGPEDLTNAQVAEILAGVFERPVRYVQAPVPQLVAGMKQAGLPDLVAELYGEMYAGMLAGRVINAEPRDEVTTTPTTLAAFAREVLRPALLAQQL